MQFWTNSTWHSPLHRVIKRGGETPDTASDLVSIVMFAGKDTAIESVGWRPDFSLIFLILLTTIYQTKYRS